MGLRVAPREVELLTAWAFHQEPISRLWVLQADQWGDSRAEGSMTIAVQLDASQPGNGRPDTDTSHWEEQLNSLLPPDVSLRVLAPAAEPTAVLPGGIEIFRRLKAPGAPA